MEKFCYWRDTRNQWHGLKNSENQRKLKSSESAIHVVYSSPSRLIILCCIFNKCKNHRASSTASHIHHCWRDLQCIISH
ncbi:hypothetical protein FKM82_017707 [Ascaphus truei]